MFNFLKRKKKYLTGPSGLRRNRALSGRSTKSCGARASRYIRNRKLAKTKQKQNKICHKQNKINFSQLELQK